MTLELSLSTELEGRLQQEAKRQGLSPDVVTLKLLEQHLPSADRRAALIALLHQWKTEDEALTEEECAANAEVLRSIDEDRLSERKLFARFLQDKPT